MAAKQKNLKIVFNSYVESVTKKKKGWLVKIRNTDDNSISAYAASILIDATELGDVAKLCGVKYDIGMESRKDTGEDIAPEMKMK
jgi:L-2-hydroxyglutarate oxidase LhgO